MEAIQVELMLAGWSETHSGGAKVTFWVSTEDLEHFRHATVKKGGTAGQRYMAALVEVGPDEQPVSSGQVSGLAKDAVLKSKDSLFQRFAGHMEEMDPGEETARICILHWCRIESRKELATNLEAQKQYGRLMEMFRTWQQEHGL